MKLFVGLGNPGAEYAGNRHNVGFMAVDAIAAAHGFPPWRQALPGLTAEGTLARRAGAAAQAADLHERVRPRGRRGRALLQARPCRHRSSSMTSSTWRPARCGSRPAAALPAITASARSRPSRQRLSSACASASAIPAPRNWCKTCAADFVKADREWLEPLLGAIAKAARDLADGANDKFQSFVAHAMHTEA